MIQPLDPALKPPPTPWFSLMQFAGSLLAIFACWSAALGLAFLEFTQRFGGDLFGSPAALQAGSSPLLMGAGLALSGFLLLPSIYYSLRRVLGRPVTTDAQVWRSLLPTLMVFTLPVVLLLGYWASQIDQWSWLLLPVLHILAVGLPVLWLAYLALRGLPLGSLQRRWGVFASGLTLGPAIIIVVEFAAMLGFALLFVLALAVQPSMVGEMQSLAQKLALDRSSPEALTRLLSPYLTNPITMLGVLTFGAALVPLIEELIKPVGVWLLVGFDLTPAAGFTAGALSGAGYALFESLALGSSGGREWAFLVIARIGTGAIHILNTALVGWAMASAWQERRYIRLGFTYLLAVCIHGLWNALTLFNAFSSLLAQSNGLAGYPIIASLGSVAPAALGVLALEAFLVILAANRYLQDRPKFDHPVG